MHTLLGERIVVGVAAQEPEQLLDNSLEEDALRGDQGESLGQIEPNLTSEDADRTDSGAVIFEGAILANIPQEVLICCVNHLNSNEQDAPGWHVTNEYYTRFLAILPKSVVSICPLCYTSRKNARKPTRSYQ